MPIERSCDLRGHTLPTTGGAFYKAVEASCLFARPLWRVLAVERTLLSLMNDRKL
jgi:hypothetical protein